MVRVAQRPAAANRHEARVADLRKDHNLAIIRRPCDVPLESPEVASAWLRPLLSQ
jgi:hypothetical protein